MDLDTEDQEDAQDEEEQAEGEQNQQSNEGNKKEDEKETNSGEVLFFLSMILRYIIYFDCCYWLIYQLFSHFNNIGPQWANGIAGY